MQFMFENPEVHGIDLIQLGDYVAGGDINEENPTIAHFLLSGRQSVYILNEVLLTPSLTVSVEDSQETGLAVNVELINKAIGSADVDIETSSSTEGIVTYQGKTPLAVGFQAVEMGVDGGSWTIKDLTPKFHLGVNSASVEAGAKLPAPQVFEADSLLDLDD
jgi:hypothetical protein